MSAILDLLIAKSKSTQGHCGMTTTTIGNQLNLDNKTVKIELNKLYKSKSITNHPSIHGMMAKAKI